MVSAFERPRLMEVVVPLKKKKEDDNDNEERAAKYGADTETEDEEVKMNCIGGFSGIQDSDISSEDDSSSSDDDSDDLTQDGEEEEERPEVLNFSTSQVRQSFAIQCPRPTRASPHESLANPASDVSDMEESDNDDSGSESDDEASDSEDEESDEEEEDDDEEEEETPLYRSESDDEASDSEDEESDEEEEDDDEEEEETEEEQLEEATVPTATPPRVPVVRIVESVEKLAQDDHHHRKSLIDAEKELQTRHTDLESLIGEDDVEEDDEDEENDVVEERDDDLMGSAVLDRSISRNMPLVGEEPRQQPVKRCLSPESIASSSDEDDDYSSSSSNKRMRREDTSTPTLVLPELTLGPSAFLSVPAPSVSPSCCSSETAEDQRLSEELMEASTPSDADWDVEEREQATVPLLTPPGSPLRVEGTSTTVCEWPSNLTIDNAIHLMPPLMMMNCCTSPSDSSCDELEFGREPSTSAPSSHLTPLIRGLAV
eukprot:CAMPEP_0194065424 /NCGR_PEP_ID=MMETSP0009_2-20130614/85460_1 /TAXON_ID=210454 /ORGANISM="Grammatophora oceanica, Strain CCMP 410" /LENGTH=485 /DNA_ID=CAMNT_0038718267 /DNA_START=277 /DNA_END=1734 /DNA_ORIENTATION=-